MNTRILLGAMLSALAAGCTGGGSPAFWDAGDGATDGDTDGDTDSDTDSDSDSDSDGDGGPTGLLTGTLRDFSSTHPDFEYVIGAETGIVEDQLGPDKKPVYAGASSGTSTTNGPNEFNQWFNDVDGVNMSTEFSIQLVDDGTGVYVYDDQEFFPIDGQLLGDEGNNHNFHFTYELHTKFTYKGGEVFRFTGDDDLWVFINGVLAIDLGGVHGQLTQEADLDDMAAQLGIAVDNVYDLDFFFAERHTSESHFRIDTTITDLVPGIE